MTIGRKLTLVVLLASGPVWAQSDSTPAPDRESSAPIAGTSQKTPEQSPPQPPEQASFPEDSSKLEPLKIEKAAYPMEAREKQLQGQVVVRILVSVTGDVENVEVVSGDPVLARSAVAAAKKWKFKPFIKNGKPVAVHTKLPFNFAFTENIHVVTATPSDTDGTASSDEPTKRVRVPQGVSAGLLTYRVQPVYPPGARLSRIQGTVVLHAVISKEGRITDLRLISGPKELAPAAIGAVQQWRYRPYLLMGNPVEVDTEVQVNFRLQ